MDFSRMSDNDKRQLEAMMERKQMQDFLRLYNNLSMRCFEDCVTDFTTRSVTTKEGQCVTRCVDKFLKMSQRLSQRFAEHQTVQQQ